MLLAETTFQDVFWYLLVFFLWIMFFWIFITVVADIFRRDDMTGWKKAAPLCRADSSSGCASPGRSRSIPR